MGVREAAGREARTTAGVIDGQSVETTESLGLRCYDAAKQINGRKRHIVTDTIGLAGRAPCRYSGSRHRTRAAGAN